MKNNIKIAKAKAYLVTAAEATIAAAIANANLKSQ